MIPVRNRSSVASGGARVSDSRRRGVSLLLILVVGVAALALLPLLVAVEDDGGRRAQAVRYWTYQQQSLDRGLRLAMQLAPPAAAEPPAASSASYLYDDGRFRVGVVAWRWGGALASNVAVVASAAWLRVASDPQSAGAAGYCQFFASGTFDVDGFGPDAPIIWKAWVATTASPLGGGE